jgi:HSP20 family protein
MLGGRTAGVAGSWMPLTDIEQTESAVIYKLDLPGMKPEDITIEVHAGMLTVSGERKHEAEETHEGYYSRERITGHFARTFTLPKGTAQEDIAATFTDGVLAITVPRTAEAKPRTISIGTDV